MTAQRPISAENIDHLLENIDLTASKLTEINDSKVMVSQQEINDLIKNLHTFNTNFEPNFWLDKKLAYEGMNATIEKALNALALFQKAAHKNVEQAIVSLFSTLAAELNNFDKNLRNLKDLRIGVKVEKAGEAKEA